MSEALVPPFLSQPVPASIDSWKATTPAFSVRLKVPTASTQDDYTATETVTPPHPADFNPFLLPSAPATDHELNKSIHEAFVDLQLSLDDLTPHRIKVAYRLCRELANQLRMARVDQPLAEAFEDETKWHELKPIPVPKYVYHADFRTASKHAAMLSVMPPPHPYRFRPEIGSDKPQSGYHPEDANQDKNLHAYIACIKNIYLGKNLSLGSKRWPEYGHYGFIGLDDPTQIRRLFPTTQEILAFERVLIYETLNKLVNSGAHETLVWLADELGIDNQEAINMLGMARRHSNNIVNNDVDEDKRIMVLRLEALAVKARDALDTRTELHILKQLSIVQGITRAEPNDFETEISSMVRKWQDEKAKFDGKPRIIDVPAHINLPPPPKKITATVKDTAIDNLPASG